MSSLSVRALLRDANPSIFAKDYTAVKEKKLKGARDPTSDWVASY